MMADGKTRLLEFRARELSHRQVFVAADDLGLLDVGEEVEVLIAARGERLRCARALVVGSERVFAERTELTERGLRLTASGYRLAWRRPARACARSSTAVCAAADGGGFAGDRTRTGTVAITRGF